MKILLGSLVVLLVVPAAIPAVALEPLLLYDHFNAPEIDPGKWIGTESFAAPLNPNTQASRLVKGKALNVKLTTYGNTNSNSGRQTGRFGLLVRNPGAITAMEATVTVLKAEVQDCANNTETSRARTSLSGTFFNDGSSTGPSDRTGNIGATIQKLLDAKGNRIFFASIFRCSDPACNSAPDLVSHVFESTWTLRRADTLRLELDRDGTRFLYTVNPDTPDEQTAALSYTQTDTLPPLLEFKGIRAVNSAANCTDDRKKVSIDAKFDDVKLKREAVQPSTLASTLAALTSQCSVQGQPVLSCTNPGSQTVATITPVVAITFREAMNRTSVERFMVVTLRNITDAITITEWLEKLVADSVVALQWNAASTQLTIQVLKVARQLENGKSYEVFAFVASGLCVETAAGGQACTGSLGPFTFRVAL